MLTGEQLRRAAGVVADRGEAVRMGRVVRVAGQMMEAHLSGAHIGDLIEVQLDGGWMPSEVVGFRDALVIATPMAALRGLRAGAAVRKTGRIADVPVGVELLGRVIDPMGTAIDGGPPVVTSARMPIENQAPALGARGAITERFDTSVRVIDALLTCGRGQRVGIFAGAGVGKTVLVRQIANHSSADVTVLGLVGERGCEVRDLLDSEIRARSVVVAATSDQTPMERVRGAQAATAIAEWFASQGKHVLLIIDSLTRYAMALREIGLGASELPATKGYPPSVFAMMPRLLERVAPFRHGGSITAFYTVLVEGDDLSDPVADSARSLLDGHLVLSRDLAARGHFPAVDVLASASRVSQRVTGPETQALARRVRGLLATRREAEDLRSLGAYVAGANPAFDEALALAPKLDAWARQDSSDPSNHEAAIAQLGRLITGGAR